VLQPRLLSFRQYLSPSPSAHLRQSVVVATATVSTPSAQGTRKCVALTEPTGRKSIESILAFGLAGDTARLCLKLSTSRCTTHC
jgi:hypothetical protein